MAIKFDLAGWAKIGLVTGLFWGLIILLLGTAIGGLFGSFGGLSGLVGGSIIGATIGGAVGIFLTIFVAIFAAIKFVVGRFITQYTGWFVTSPYWRIFQVAIIGRITLNIISSLLSGSAIALFGLTMVGDVIFALIDAWIVIFMYKKLGWKIPN